MADSTMMIKGRAACYVVVYSLDATRCVILHLAAAQSLQRAAGGRLGVWTAGGCVSVIELALSQVWPLSYPLWGPLPPRALLSPASVTC